MMSGTDEAIEAIFTRRSIRKFSPREVPGTMLDSLIEAGRRAPSPHDSQPWLFVIISEVGERRRFARALRGAYSAYLDSVNDERAREKAERAYRRTSSAPLLMLICLDLTQLRDQPSESRRHGEWLMGSQSVAAAAENVLLAAHAEGLGGCWRGAPIFCASAIRRCLRLPLTIEPQVLLELGFPAEEPARKRLKPKDEVVRYGLGAA